MFIVEGDWDGIGWEGDREGQGKGGEGWGEGGEVVKLSFNLQTWAEPGNPSQ